MAVPTRCRTAFNLVELLVVVAIIALLISLLFPALARAREEGRRAVCAGHLSQMGKAQNAYNLTYNEWIPGSPLTTGYYFLMDKNGLWGSSCDMASGGLRYNRFATSWYDWPTTLQMIMYGGASVPAPASSAEADVHTARARILKKAVTGVFHCPSNREFSDPLSLTGLPTGYYPRMEAVSYLSMGTFLQGGPNLYTRMREYPKAYPGLDSKTQVLTGHVAHSKIWGVRVPDDYMPRLTKLGQAGTKVFLADGTRYVDEDFLDTGRGITYSIDYKGAKLHFAAGPPSKAELDLEYVGNSVHDTASSNEGTYGTVYGREYTYAKEFSYRHGAKDRINALFFDGHVESLLVMGHRVPPKTRFYPGGLIFARFYGPAVNPKYYYPSGSIIKKPDEVFHPLRGQKHAIGTKLD